jgi:hypothetical protein
MKEKSLELPEADFLPGLWWTWFSLQWTCPFVWEKKRKRRFGSCQQGLYSLDCSSSKLLFLLESHISIFSDIFPNEDFILFYFKLAEN